MKKQIYHWLDVAEIASIGTSLILPIFVQQLLAASIPLSCALGLNLVNRKRVEQENQTLISESMTETQSEIRSLIEKSQQINNEHEEKLRQQMRNLEDFTTHLNIKTTDVETKLQKLDEKEEYLHKLVGELQNIEHISQEIEANPSSAQFYYQRGFSRQQLGDRQGAFHDYTLAIRYDRNYAKAFYNRGLVNAELNDKKRAVDDFRKAAKIYFDQGDLENYQKAKDLSRESHDLNSRINDTAVEKLVVGSLFS